jgi:hypothetical protein
LKEVPNCLQFSQKFFGDHLTNPLPVSGQTRTHRQPST